MAAKLPRIDVVKEIHTLELATMEVMQLYRVARSSLIIILTEAPG